MQVNLSYFQQSLWLTTRTAHIKGFHVRRYLWDQLTLSGEFEAVIGRLKHIFATLFLFTIMDLWGRLLRLVTAAKMKSLKRTKYFCSPSEMVRISNWTIQLDKKTAWKWFIIYYWTFCLLYITVNRKTFKSIYVDILYIGNTDRLSFRMGIQDFVNVGWHFGLS